MAKIKLKFTGKPVRAGAVKPRNTGGIMNTTLLKIMSNINKSNKKNG